MNESQVTTTNAPWIRGLYIVMYFVIFYILWMVLVAVAVLQFLSSVFFKTPNKNLENFGQSLSIYVHDIIQYVTYNTEKKPYPFANWPTTKH